MGRATTETCCLTLPLKLEKWQADRLEKRFEIARQLYNTLLRFELKKLTRLEESEEYIAIQNKLKETTDNTERNKLYKELDKLRKDAGFSEYTFKSDIKDFYKHFSKNDEAFEHMLVAEEEVSTEMVMVAGNDAKIIRLLKAMKAEPRLTDDQEATIEKLIGLWENGEIPARISKDVLKKSKLVSDVLELYYEIMKLIPPSYFEEKSKQGAQVDGEKQVILSCYLKAGGSKK